MNSYLGRQTCMLYEGAEAMKGGITWVHPGFSWNCQVGQLRPLPLVFSVGQTGSHPETAGRSSAVVALLRGITRVFLPSSEPAVGRSPVSGDRWVAQMKAGLPLLVVPEGGRADQRPTRNPEGPIVGITKIGLAAITQRKRASANEPAQTSQRKRGPLVHQHSNNQNRA
jgi:hypothetical protein